MMIMMMIAVSLDGYRTATNSSIVIVCISITVVMVDVTRHTQFDDKHNITVIIKHHVQL